MWDFSILLSVRLMLRTIPFLILRLAVALFWGALLAAAGFAAFVLLATVARLNEGIEGAVDPRIWFFLVVCTVAATGVVFLILRWLRKWALYRVKAAHVAVLVEYVQGRALPKGTGQIRYGRAVVQERFGEAAAFFLLDEMIRTVLRGVDRATNRLASFLPGKTAAMIVMPLHLVLKFAFSFMDEIMLAHAIDARSQDGWESARRALRIYGESRLVILKNVLWLSVFAAGLGALAFYGVISPAWEEYTAARNPETLRALILAGVASLALSALFFGPFALICLMQVWFRRVLGEGTRATRDAGRGPVMVQSDGSAVGLSGGGTRNGDLV